MRTKAPTINSGHNLPRSLSVLSGEDALFLTALLPGMPAKYGHDYTVLSKDVAWFHQAYGDIIFLVEGPSDLWKMIWKCIRKRPDF